MAEQKRFYWIKLKNNFFDIEAIDWLMSQKHGCSYVVLYQKLCLLAANKDGRLFSEIGEMLIPYDAHKISRDTKFDIDTVVVALELFKKLGLIYEEENGVLLIPYVNEIIGSETVWAEKKREYRQRQIEDNVSDNVRQEIRDKSIENKSIDIKNKENKEKETNNGADAPKHSRKSTAFVKPTIEEITAYCKEKGYNIDAEYFFNHYEANGWICGKTPMKNWRATLANWAKRQFTDGRTQTKPEQDNENNKYDGLF